MSGYRMNAARVLAAGRGYVAALLAGVDGWDYHGPFPGDETYRQWRRAGWAGRGWWED